MGGKKIDYGKERFARGPVPPVGVHTRFIPRGDRGMELVIRFRIVGAVISRCPQPFTEAFNLRGKDHTVIGELFNQVINGPHIMSPGAGRVHARDQGMAARGTDTGNREGTGIADPFCRQPVKIGCHGSRVTVTAQCRCNILAGDPEDVGTESQFFSAGTGWSVTLTRAASKDSQAADQGNHKNRRFAQHFRIIEFGVPIVQEA